MVYGYCNAWPEKNKPFVYFISDCSNHIKIGVADDIRKRLLALQTGNAEELNLVFAFKVDTKNAALRLEKELHSLFKQHRVSGEWFEADPIISYLKQPKIKTNEFVFKGMCQ